MLLSLIGSGLVIYGICWALHAFSNYLDFEAPSKAEKKYKLTIKNKYDIDGAKPTDLIGVVLKNKAELHKRAMAHARHLMNKVQTEDMTQEQAVSLFKYYYQHYIDKYKFSYL